MSFTRKITDKGSIAWPCTRIRPRAPFGIHCPLSEMQGQEMTPHRANAPYARQKLSEDRCQSVGLIIDNVWEFHTEGLTGPSCLSQVRLSKPPSFGQFCGTGHF